MISKVQIRAAMGALNITMQDLATAVSVQRNTISIFLNKDVGMQSKNLGKIESYLRSRGVEFLLDDGVRLRKSSKT